MEKFKDFTALFAMVKKNRSGVGKSYGQSDIKDIPLSGILAIPSSEKFLRSARIKVSKIFKKGVPIETIIFANCSEDMQPGTCSMTRYRAFKDSLVRRNKNTDWLT
jgi:hypothetical protein